jgi:hypothetical protein
MQTSMALPSLIFIKKIIKEQFAFYVYSFFIMKDHKRILPETRKVIFFDKLMTCVRTDFHSKGRFVC